MISIIITVLNEDINLLKQTIESLIHTIDSNDEIIIIDDNSDIPVNLSYDKIKLHRNTFRIGVAQSRHYGACLAQNKWLLFTDAHMIFHPDWRKNFINYQNNSKENTIYNGTCLGLWETDKIINPDLSKLPKYYGARLSLFEYGNSEILEGKWTQEKKDEDNYEISCLMGAIYFIQKDYFFKLRGLSDLKMWGSDEPCLSLKTLLSGGEIRQLKNVQAAHIFRSKAPYITYNKYLIYNKLRMVYTLLPEKNQKTILNKFVINDDFKEAVKIINNEYKIIEEYKNYYQSIFIKTIKEVCDEYTIK